MNIHEAPEGYIYYDGLRTTSTIYCEGDVPSGWALIKSGILAVEKVDDGLTREWWESIQQGGERDDYSYAFCNSAYTCLNPLYPIKADNVMYMFMGCNLLGSANNILIHIESERPNMMYVCANCNSMTRPPIFNFVRAPIVKTYTSMYASCYSLLSANVYWGDGTTDPVTERSACQNMFFKCWALTDIDFGEENTGSPTKLDLSYCKNLKVVSVESLLASLQTIPNGSYGTYEIILAQETVDNLTANYPDTLTGFATKGWTIVSKLRERGEGDIYDW